MKFLEHELSEQKRGLNIKHEAGAEANTIPVKSENIDALGRKIRELEAMVKGLTEEMLDLKSVTRKLAMQLEEMCGSQPRVRVESQFCQKKQESTPETGRPVPAVFPRVAQSVTSMRARTSHHAISPPVPEPVPEPEVPVEQMKAGEFEYVMQPDGTIQKRKKTTDHSVIIAETGYNPCHRSRSMAVHADSETVMDDAKKHR